MKRLMTQKKARLPRNSRSEDTQLGDSSRMESPPSMEVEELLTLSFHGYRTEEKTGPNAKALANVEEGKAFVEGKTCCHWKLQG